MTTFEISTERDSAGDVMDTSIEDNLRDAPLTSNERRTEPTGDSSFQILMVNGPDVPLLPFGKRATDIRPLPRSAARATRLLDICLAGCLLVATAPIMAMCALATKMTSRGPVIFQQERVGRGGVTFLVLKFRTMKLGTHEAVLSSDEIAEYANNNFKLDAADPRIHSVGRLLRRWSLDELPQLINVLKGDMSMVGVRPIELVEYATRPEVDQLLYCRLRPGITGLWQVSGRSALVRNQRIVIDRHYCATWSLKTDLKILARTPKILIGKGGVAY